MNPKIAREKLNLFVDTLPDSVFFPLRDKGVDPNLLTTDIASEHEFVIRETGNICEGVLRILKGEDSPSNFLGFIHQDQNIDEENRLKLPVLAYELQTRVFDVVLPLLKQAGLPIREGRVPAPAPEAREKFEVRSSKFEGTTTPPQSSPLKRGGGDERPPLEEKNMRALLRIAVGTKYTEGELRDAFEALPVGLRQSLSSVDTANAIQDIAKKYMLHVDQMAALASETGLVLLGITHPADFIRNLAGRLRMPDEKARDIARDISSQILVKVRDALRGLHESPGDMGVPSSSTGRVVSSVATPVTPPAASEGGTPLGRGDLPKSTTPYSAGAKWNTGENVLSKQTEPGPLNRAEVLRGIENPTTAWKPPAQTQLPATERKGTVGPTGWRPQQPTTNNLQPTTDNQQPKPPMPLAPKPPTPPMPPIASSTEKTRPQSDVAFPPPTPKPTSPPQDFLDQKLSAPMSVPNEEKRYTTDPYREPLQ